MMISHWDRGYFTITAIHCFKNGYFGKQPLAWKEYCGLYLPFKDTVRLKVTHLLIGYKLCGVANQKCYFPMLLNLGKSREQFQDTERS